MSPQAARRPLGLESLFSARVQYNPPKVFRSLILDMDKLEVYISQRPVYTLVQNNLTVGVFRLVAHCTE